MRTRKQLSEAEAVAIIEDDATAWTLVPDQGEAASIRLHVASRDEATAELDQAVIRARRRGLTWMQIGAALGVSHQAARKKYVDRV